MAELEEKQEEEEEKREEEEVIKWGENLKDFVNTKFGQSFFKCPFDLQMSSSLSRFKWLYWLPNRSTANSTLKQLNDNFFYSDTTEHDYFVVTSEECKKFMQDNGINFNFYSSQNYVNKFKQLQTKEPFNSIVYKVTKFDGSYFNIIYVPLQRNEQSAVNVYRVLQTAFLVPKSVLNPNKSEHKRLIFMDPLFNKPMPNYVLKTLTSMYNHLWHEIVIATVFEDGKNPKFETMEPLLFDSKHSLFGVLESGHAVSKLRVMFFKPPDLVTATCSKGSRCPEIHCINYHPPLCPYTPSVCKEIQEQPNGGGIHFDIFRHTSPTLTLVTRFVEPAVAYFMVSKTKNLIEKISSWYHTNKFVWSDRDKLYVYAISEDLQSIKKLNFGNERLNNDLQKHIFLKYIAGEQESPMIKYKQEYFVVLPLRESLCLTMKVKQIDNPTNSSLVLYSLQHAAKLLSNKIQWKTIPITL